jgi:putative ABC transport system permease protein
MPAIRNVLRSPRIAIPVVMMFALAIAANSAIFGVFNGLFLTSLPFPHADRLVYVANAISRFGSSHLSLSYADLRAFRASSAFENIAAFKSPDGGNLTGFGDPVRVNYASVTSNMAATLGIQPILGRDFQPSEEITTGARPILLSYGLWQRVFAARTDVVGRVILIDKLPFTIIGVLPKTAVFPGDIDLWMTLGPYFSGEKVRIYSGLGRMKPGVVLAAAQAGLPRTAKDVVPVAIPLRDRYLGNYRTVSEVLLSGVALLLLIACVNAGGLMLARAAGRSREIAIREALGAGRARLIRHLLVESFFLAATAEPSESHLRGPSFGPQPRSRPESCRPGSISRSIGALSPSRSPSPPLPRFSPASSPPGATPAPIFAAISPTQPRAHLFRAAASAPSTLS